MKYITILFLFGAYPIYGQAVTDYNFLTDFSIRINSNDSLLFNLYENVFDITTIDSSQFLVVPADSSSFDPKLTIASGSSYFYFGGQRNKLTSFRLLSGEYSVCVDLSLKVVVGQSFSSLQEFFTKSYNNLKIGEVSGQQYLMIHMAIGDNENYRYIDRSLIIVKDKFNDIISEINLYEPH